MTRNHAIILSITTLLLLVGCIIPGARREREEIALMRNDSLFVVDEGDFHFRIVMPKDLMISNEPHIEFDAHRNSLHIICGSEFHLIATETVPQSISSLKDGIFTLRVVDNEDNSCIYKRILPDGSPFDFGLLQQIFLSEKHYSFQSAADGEFSLEDVLRMKMALASIKL